MQASQIAKKVKTTDVSVTKTVDTECKLPVPEKTPAREKGKAPAAINPDCPMTVDLMKTTSGSGAGTGQSAIQSLAEKALGIMVLAKILANPLGNHKVALEEVLSKTLDKEQDRSNTDTLLAKRSKQSVLTAINLDNFRGLLNVAQNDRSLVLLKLPTTKNEPVRATKNELPPANFANL